MGIKKYFGFILIFVIGLIPLIDLFNPGLPITHDGMDHIARIANFYNGLTEGIIFPRWAQNLNWGYGHPILMFLYPLSSYFASLFHFLGADYINSVKLVFGTGYILSGITMYLWARKQFNEHFGIAAALIYLFTPYRFVDLYVRGAIGEHMSFIFPPLILYFLLVFFRSKTYKKNYLSLVGISISLAFLLLAHNAISLMFVPVILVYTFLLWYQTKQWGKFVLSLTGLTWGLLIAAFFVFPSFFEGKYTLRDIVTGDEYKDRFVKFASLLYGAWNYGITGQFSVQIGIANILGFIFTPFVFLRTKKKSMNILLLMFLTFCVISIFLMLPQSNPIYETFTTLKKFQFPWRFLSLTTFTTSILGASFLLIIKNRAYKNISIFILITLLFVTTFNYWKAKGYVLRTDTFFSAKYHGTTDTGESSPIWSIRSMEKEPKAHMEFIDGTGSIKELARTSTTHSYQVSVSSEKARVKDNTLYFPNWTVYVNNQKTDIEFQDVSQRGLITFFLPKGNNKVEVIFANTKLRVFANTISMLALLAIPIFGIVIWRKHEK
jgi:hypothetical protein